nr:hypothetical protein [uncultured Pseudomonas sp.]
MESFKPSSGPLNNLDAHSVTNRHVLFSGAASKAGGGASQSKVGRLVPGDPKYLSELLAYKRSNHQLMAGYFRTWRDRASDPVVNKAVIDQVPDLLDILLLFPGGGESDYFWQVLKNQYVPNLREKGIKVLISQGVESTFEFDNSQEGYEAYARHIMEEYVEKYNLDGMDFGVERLFSAEVLVKVTGMFNALSKRLGPASGSGKLLTYNTNQDGDTPLFQQVGGKIDYVFQQAYGRLLSGMEGLLNTYRHKLEPRQFVPGFTFYEENISGGGFHDTEGAPDSRADQYAKWQPADGVKGGLFAYALDRDDILTDDILAPTYETTKRLILTMSPGAATF